MDVKPDPLRDSEKQSISWLRKQPQEMTKRHTHVTKSVFRFALIQIVVTPTSLVLGHYADLNRNLIPMKAWECC